MRGFGLPACGRGVTVPTSTKPKPSDEQRVDVRAVLVQAGGQADRIRERQAEGLGRQRLRLARQQRIEAGAVRRLDRRQAESVRALGIEAEQEGAGESVHQCVTPPWQGRSRPHDDRGRHPDSQSPIT